MNDQVRWAACYLRVSSEEQKERQSIRNQEESIKKYLALHPEMRVYKWYRDDGVSGSVPIAERPAGRPLAEDSLHGTFSVIIMTRADRLGRDAVDLLLMRQVFTKRGVQLVAVEENIEDEFSYDIRAVIAAEDKRRTLDRLWRGMNRAAAEGRYCGGIVPLGFMVEGFQKTARLVPSDRIIRAGWTEAGLVKNIYRWLAVDGWSCRRIAQELNALGVPTAYQKDGRLLKDSRGERTKRTQGIWRPGRVRNLVTNPIYKGEPHYGRRSGKVRDIIVAKIEGLVSEEIWDAAQETLARNRIIAKNTNRVYLLRSVIKCGLCGLTYSGYWDRGQVRYKCNGALVERGPIEGRCPNRSFYGYHLEDVVWRDVEVWLRNPGDVLDELTSEIGGSPAAAAAEADRLTLERVLKSFSSQRDRVLDLYRRELITFEDLQSQLGKIADEQKGVEQRLATLDEEIDTAPAPISPDLLEEIRARLDGLDDARRQEIVSLLVHRIVIRTEELDGEKRVVAVVEYRFPRVVSSSTGRGSSPPPA